MFSARSLISLSCSALLVLAAYTPAWAGVFNVKPIRVFLSKGATSAIITVDNQDTSPLRLQLSGVVWSNDRNGQPQLKPTDDLIVFPTLITMNALEERNIRVGFSGTAPSDKELAFRIVLDELPSLESQLSKANVPGLSVRTRITVPIFVLPDTAVRRAALNEFSLSRGVAHAFFTNSGNVHLITQSAQIVGLDANGVKLLSKTVQGWYVLAGETRDFQVSIPRLQCARLRKLTVTVKTDIGSFTRSADVARAQCA